MVTAVRRRDLHNESDLLGRLQGRAFKHLGGEVSGKGDELACDEAVAALVAGKVQRWPVEERRQVECGKRVEDHDFVGGIGIDGLVKREERRGVVEGLV